MSSGPIEFLSDHADHRTPPGEYGGADGLIQPAPHAMTPSEANSAMTRAAMNGTDNGDSIIDPATGRVVDPDLLH